MAFVPIPPPNQYYSHHMLSYFKNEDGDDQLGRRLPPHTTVISVGHRENDGASAFNTMPTTDATIISSTFSHDHTNSQLLGGSDDVVAAIQQVSAPSSFPPPPPPRGGGYQYDDHEFGGDEDEWCGNNSNNGLFDSNFWSSLYPFLSSPSSYIINTHQGIQEGDRNAMSSSHSIKEDHLHHHHHQHDDHDHDGHEPAAMAAAVKGIGIIRYSEEERKDRILRYLNKRHHRNFNKTIKYACRKTLADKRVRVRGRFAKNNHICGGGHDSMKEDIIDDHDDHHTGDLYHYHHHQFQVVHGVMAKQDEEEEWLEEAITSLMYNTP